MAPWQITVYSWHANGLFANDDDDDDELYFIKK